MDKRLLILAVVITAALGATAAHAIAARDVYTDGGASMDARNPYTDGGLAARFDVYADGAKAGKFDSYTDGAHAPTRDCAR